LTLTKGRGSSQLESLASPTGFELQSIKQNKKKLVSSRQRELFTLGSELVVTESADLLFLDRPHNRHQTFIDSEERRIPFHVGIGQCLHVHVC
jgi:hypothetical protein